MARYTYCRFQRPNQDADIHSWKLSGVSEHKHAKGFLVKQYQCLYCKKIRLTCVNPKDPNYFEKPE